MAALAEEKLKIYKELTETIQTLINQKQQVVSQLNENTLVKGELDLIDDDGTKIFKLVGPVMLPIELGEAKENVGKRLEFIEGEVVRIEKLTNTKEAELASLGDEVRSIILWLI